MKKITLLFFAVILIFVGCKNDLAKEPKRLIEKEVMVDILYDLSVLSAMRSHNAAMLDSFKTNTNQYIYKKYKIDSVQFAQSNSYYAADFKEYKIMYEEVKTRLDKAKTETESRIKVDEKKATLLAKKNKKLQVKKATDSVKKAKTKMQREVDSLKKIVQEEKKRRAQLKK